MGPADRRETVLTVLEQSGVAMTAVDVFRNCKIRGASFERRTTKYYLAQLLEDEEVVKLDAKAMHDGDLAPVDSSERGHFMARSAYEQYRD